MRDEPIHLLRGTIRWRIVLLCSGWEDRVYVGSAEAVPFQSYSTSEDARAYIDGILAGESLPCFAEALSEVEGGVEEAPALHSSSYTAPATQFPVRMLVSRRIAIAFRDCARGLAQVLPSRKSGARSG